jgi:hypothetical protein
MRAAVSADAAARFFQSVIASKTKQSRVRHGPDFGLWIQEIASSG